MVEENIFPKEKGGKEGSFTSLAVVMVFTLIIAGLWDSISIIKKSIHYLLDPTAGNLLAWNLNLGMLVIVLIIAIATTLVQKYATDQKTLKELRIEQKALQAQMKEFKNHPEKLMDLQKKQFAMIPRQMKLSTRAIIYTGIPFVLFFRWFSDYFASVGGVNFWLGLNWFWFYLIFTMIFSSIFRKWWDVV